MGFSLSLVWKNSSITNYLEKTLVSNIRARTKQRKKKLPTKQSGNDGLLKINFRDTFKTKGNEKICALILFSIPVTLSILQMYLYLCSYAYHWVCVPYNKFRYLQKMAWIAICRDFPGPKKKWRIKENACSCATSSLDFLNIHFIRIIMKWCVQVIISLEKFDSVEKHHQMMPVPQ